MPFLDVSEALKIEKICTFLFVHLAEDKCLEKRLYYASKECLFDATEINSREICLSNCVCVGVCVCVCILLNEINVIDNNLWAHEVGQGTWSCPKHHESNKFNIT